MHLLKVSWMNDDDFFIQPNIEALLLPFLKLFENCQYLGSPVWVCGPLQTDVGYEVLRCGCVQGDLVAGKARLGGQPLKRCQTICKAIFEARIFHKWSLNGLEDRIAQEVFLPGRFMGWQRQRFKDWFFVLLHPKEIQAVNG